MPQLPVIFPISGISRRPVPPPPETMLLPCSIPGPPIVLPQPATAPSLPYQPVLPLLSPVDTATLAALLPKPSQAPGGKIRVLLGHLHRRPIFFCDVLAVPRARDKYICIVLVVLDGNFFSNFFLTVDLR